MLNDTLSTALSNIMNGERSKKSTRTIMPISKLIENVLNIMHDNHYIGEIDKSESSRGQFINLQLIGRINKCGSIKPRFSVNLNKFEKFEKQYLPAKDFGILIVSTPKGVMTHTEAKRKGVGGSLLAYCY